MKASRFTEAQKAFILKQGEEGTPVADASEKLEAWRRDCNNVRPHSVIGYNVLIELHIPGGATSPSP